MPGLSEFSVERVEGFEFLIRLKWGPSQGSSVRVRGSEAEEPVRVVGMVSRGFEVSRGCGLGGQTPDACSKDFNSLILD